MTRAPLAAAVLDAAELSRGMPAKAPPAWSDPSIRRNWRRLTWTMLVLGVLLLATLAGLGVLLRQGALADAHIQSVGQPVPAICRGITARYAPRMRQATYQLGGTRYSAAVPFAGPWGCPGEVSMTLLVDPADPFLVGSLEGESAQGRYARDCAALLGLIAAGLGWSLGQRVRDANRVHRLISRYPVVTRRVERVVRTARLSRTVLVRMTPEPGGGATRLIARARRTGAHPDLLALAPGTTVQVVGAPGRYAALCLPGVRPVLLELPRSSDEGATFINATLPKRR